MMMCKKEGESTLRTAAWLCGRALKTYAILH